MNNGRFVTKNNPVKIETVIEASKNLVGELPELVRESEVDFLFQSLTKTTTKLINVTVKNSMIYVASKKC